MTLKLYSLKNGRIEQGIVVTGTGPEAYVSGLYDSRPFKTLADLFGVTGENAVCESGADEIRLLEVVLNTEEVSEEIDTFMLFVHGIGDQRDVLDFEPRSLPTLLESATHVGYFTTTYVSLYVLRPKTTFRLLCWEHLLASYIVTAVVHVSDNEVVWNRVNQSRTLVKWLRRLIA